MSSSLSAAFVSVLVSSLNIRDCAKVPLLGDLKSWMSTPPQLLAPKSAPNAVLLEEMGRRFSKPVDCSAVFL